jgi:hypothetical protein
MKNKYLRLFLAQTKLMTAEKMRLDRFCQHGEYLAYRIAIPPFATNNLHALNDIDFTFHVDVAKDQYFFSSGTFDEDLFSTFEMHLSVYLNELFERKNEFDQHNDMFRSAMQKLHSSLTEDEVRCLATNVDANTTAVLRALGVATDN